MSNRIPDQSPAGTLLLWGFALLWCAMSTPVLFVIPRETSRGNTIAWLGVLFPLIGVGLLLAALRLTLRTMRFKRSTLTLDATPVPIGGTLRGTVEVPHLLTSVSGIMIRLLALERVRRGKSTHETLVCHEERELAPSMVRRSAEGAIIPIEIPVPPDAPPSSKTIFWRLNVDADVPGIDYFATFDVPVQQSAFTDFRPHGAPEPLNAPLQPKCFVERQTPEGRELHFRRFNAPQRAFSSLMFLLAWLGAIGFMTFVGVPTVVPIILGLIAIPILFSTLNLFFETRTILLGHHDVTVSRRLLTSSRKVIPYADIESTRAVITADASGARPYYRVDIYTKQGRVKAAKNIRSKREAEWVASRIRK
ncbi:MAG TPA: hypothetical protein VGQ76_08900 [Thermoanaerobaculia bacterium]|nr:hypothetical protein [Thermoanaerobaculia bacterium]